MGETVQMLRDTIYVLAILLGLLGFIVQVRQAVRRWREAKMPRIPRIIHDPTCEGEEECGGTFVCEGLNERPDAPTKKMKGCGRTFGYCMGAADDMPEHCNYCWFKAHRPIDSKKPSHG